MTDKSDLHPILDKIDNISERITQISIEVATNSNVEKERHDNIRQNLITISEKLEVHSNHISTYNSSLEYHIRRTDIAEKNLKLTQKMLYITMIVTSVIAVQVVPMSILKSMISFLINLFV